MQPILLKQPHFSIINKPSGIHSDEAAKWCAATSGDKQLENWLCAHRLDQLTSGCLLICPQSKQETFLELFKAHSLELTQKVYLADIIEPYAETLPQQVNGFICSRYRRSKSVRYIDKDSPALKHDWHSKVEVSHKVSNPTNTDALAELGFSPNTVQVELHSGARHQIRAFMASKDRAILGDPLYGSEAPTSLKLHAWKLGVQDPFSENFFEATAATRILMP